MTNDPADYPWSSYHHNAMGQSTPLITPQQQYMLLATTPAARQAVNRALVHEHVEEAPRRSSTALQATACLGQRKLSVANRSAGPALSQHQASWQATSRQNFRIK
jgi:hypothetical protein